MEKILSNCFTPVCRVWITLFDVVEKAPISSRLTTKILPSLPPPMVSWGVPDELSGIRMFEPLPKSASLGMRRLRLLSG